MITLYDYELSGNCYKVRLLLSMLGLDYEKHPIEFYPAAEHKSEAFLAINPLGQLPVLQDNTVRISDSHAIMVYLANRYDTGDTWYPLSCATKMAQITQWMCFAESLTATASAARLADGFFYDLDATACRDGAHRLLRILDQHLWFHERDQHEWLVAGRRPTIADIACFAYIILCEEGGISRMDYPAVRRWTDRVKRLPGFIVMPGVFPAGPGVEPDYMEPTR